MELYATVEKAVPPFPKSTVIFDRAGQIRFLNDVRARNSSGIAHLTNADHSSARDLYDRAGVIAGVRRHTVLVAASDFYRASIRRIRVES